VDGGIARFARDDQVIVDQQGGGDLIQMPEIAAACSTVSPASSAATGFRGKKGRRNLAEMPVERGDVIDRLSADVTLAEQLRHEKSRRQMSQVAVFGRLVEQGVAQFGLVRDHLRSEQAGGSCPR